MKMVLFSLLIGFSLLRAEPASKEDIQIILKVMEANKADLENQIKAVKTDLENQIKAVKTDLENQIKAVKTDLGNQIKGTKADLENQIKGTNQRIDDVNRRIDDVNGYMLALIGGIFVTVGFIWWDRRTMIWRAKEEVKEELQPRWEQNDQQQKMVLGLLAALREWSVDKPDLQEALRRHRLVS